MRVAETQDSSDAINMNAGRLLSAGGWWAMNEPKTLHMYTGMQTSTNTVPIQKKKCMPFYFLLTLDFIVMTTTMGNLII